MNEIEVFDKPELMAVSISTIMEYAVTAKSTILDYGAEVGKIEEVEEEKQKIK